MPGFDFRFRESGGAPTIRKVVAKDTETLTKGDIINVESGQADLAVTQDVALLGACLQTVSATSAVTEIEVISDTDAVYAYTDGTAHNIGVTLDLAGATGAQVLAASSNQEFIVVATNAATEETLVKINPSVHALSGTALQD